MSKDWTDAPGNNPGNSFGPIYLQIISQNQWLVQEMYEKLQRDPSSVDKSWQDFFKSIDGTKFLNGLMNSALGETPISTFFDKQQVKMISSQFDSDFQTSPRHVRKPIASSPRHARKKLSSSERLLLKLKDLHEIEIVILCLTLLIVMAVSQKLITPLFPSRSAVSLIYIDNKNFQSKIVIVNHENKLTKYKIEFSDLNSNQLLRRESFYLQSEKTKKIQLSSLETKRSMIVHLYFQREKSIRKQELILRLASR
jgi:hypothetical protein